MADRVCVTISIGGALRRELLPDLATAVQSEGACIDWDGTPFALADLVPGQPLTVMAYEVAWGRFEELEWFCRCHSLAFARWSGGCGGSFGPERVVFDGSTEPLAFAATEDDEIVLDEGTARHLGSFAAIEAYFAAAAVRPGPLAIVDVPGNPEAHGGDHG